MKYAALLAAFACLCLATPLMAGGKSPATRPAQKTAPDAAKVAPSPAPELRALRPELVVKAAPQLGVTPELQKEIAAEVMATQTRVRGMEQRLAEELAALNELLAAPEVDQELALAQLDKVLDAERDIKKARLTLSISVAGRLTPAQVRQARDLTAKGVLNPLARAKPGDPQAVFAATMYKFETAARARAQAGGDVSELRKAMQSARALAAEGKPEEATRALEAALKRLE
jgi:Spy/CpxP family protein refolding chaperone